MEDAYVINLKSSKDRWEKIQKAFEGSNIRLHRVEPVKLVRSKYRILKRREFYGKSLSMTVLNLIKMAKRKNLPEILILEDDCSPVKGFELIWAKIKSWLRAHNDTWDLYSGGSSYTQYPFPIGDTPGVEFFIPKRTQGTHWTWLQSKTYDTVINEYNKALLNCNGQYYSCTDDVYNNLKRIVSLPYIAYQSDNYSILFGDYTSKNRIKDYKKAENTLKRQTRKLRHIKP